MKIKSLVRLAVSVILIHVWPIPSHAAGDKIAPPNTQKEIRFKTWNDKAAYEKILYLDDMRNKKFGHLLPYADTSNVDAVLNEPQVKFHLAMLLGDELLHVLDILRDHGEVNLYGSSLIFDGRGKGEEYAEIQVNLYDAQVEVTLYSGGEDGHFIPCSLILIGFHTTLRGFSIESKSPSCSQSHQSRNFDWYPGRCAEHLPISSNIMAQAIMHPS